jgi:hypothetical protein
MLTTVLLFALGASQPVTLLEGGWVASEVDEKQLEVWSDVLFSELGDYGITVRRKRDIIQVLGLERQKQLLGCEAVSCVAEIAQALDADGMIGGSIGKSGASLVLNVRVTSSAGTQLAAKSVVVPSVEAVLTELKPLARALAEAMAPRLPGRVTIKAKVTPGAKRFWWIPASVAVVSLGVGIGLQASARSLEADIRAGTGFSSLMGVQTAVTSGKAQEAGSFVFFGIAGAAVVSTLLLVVLGQDTVEGPPIALAPTLSGFALSGRWP